MSNKKTKGETMKLLDAIEEARKNGKLVKHQDWLQTECSPDFLAAILNGWVNGISIASNIVDDDRWEVVGSQPPGDATSS